MSETTETETAPEVTIPDYLERLLDQIADREGFTDYKIISQPGSNVGDGFQGQMLSVVISGTRESTDDKLVLICKIPPSNEMRLQMAVQPFKQEIYAYDRILPEMARFQRDKGITETDGFFSFPKCYGTYSNEETSEFAIVLEDLRFVGYRMWNKYKPVNYSHVKLCMAELGKFHAISFALREQKPELFEEFTQLKSTMLKNFDDYFQLTVDFFKKSYDQALTTLSEDDTEERTNVSRLGENVLKVFARVATGKLAEPHAVLCHGDFWNNNMMFLYASEDSLVPLKACLIDWQMVQYCSPATDLSYYIYSSTEQPIRTEHFDDILNEYHANLASLLKRLGGDQAKQFSSDDLQNQLRKFGVYGMAMAPVLVQVVTTAAEDLPDLDTMTLESGPDFDFMKNGIPAAYAQRMSEVIRDFTARGYFKDAFEVAKN